MRTVSLPNPFIGGIVSDVPSHRIGPYNSAFAQDLFSPSGVARNRQGWAYSGTTADVADNLVTVYRAQFALADVTRTITGDDDGDLFIHNAASAGTALFAGTVPYLARCIYRDEVIFCAQDGQTPLRRYSGSSLAGRTYATGSPTWNATKATITGTNTFASNTPVPGDFVKPTVGIAGAAYSDLRVLVGSASSITLEDIQAANTSAINTSVTVGPTGVTTPCVSVYSAGTASVGVVSATGTGTEWLNGAWGAVIDEFDAFLGLPVGAATYQQGGITAVNSDVQILPSVAELAESPYAILRRCPFKDVASHKESLWGTGVAQFPNRVYVGRPGWNVSIPPGAIPPWDPTSAYTPANPNEFLLDFIDVPTATDGDHNIAILSSPNPLLVLKRKSVYGIFGSYPPQSADMIADGIGCIDIRSAQSYDEGQFWAGEGGIYWFRNGSIIDLTQQDPNGAPNPKINREWRSLTASFDYGTLDYCSLWMASGHLFVHITTAGGTIQRTYLCDLRDGSWQSRISNLSPRYGFTSRVPGEKEQALVVQDIDQGRVIDTAPMVDGSGIAKDGDGTSPRMQAWTNSTLAHPGDLRQMSSVVDIEIEANVYDAGAAGATQVGVSLVATGGISNEAASTKTLPDLNSDPTDDIARYKERNPTKGRQHQIRLDNDLIGSNLNSTKVEIHQISVRVNDWSSHA